MKRKMKKTFAAMMAVSVLAAAMAGSVSMAEEEDATATAADALASDYQAESVSLALTADDAEFSPWSGNDGGRGYNIWLIYQPLAWLVDGEITNCLIESQEITGDDTATVTLYDYIYDSEGNHITASDVVFCFEQAQADGSVKGATYFDTVTAADDYTVDFTFKKPLALGEWEQTLSQVYIVSQDAYEASDNGMMFDPVGTGRYVLSDYVSGSSVTFTETDNYWQTNEDLITARDLANVKEITFYIITEATQRAIAIEEGTVDYADITITDTDSVLAAGKSVYEYPNTLTYQLAANCSEDSVLSDENLRKAVFYAIDSSQVAAGLSSTTGFPVYDMLCNNYVDYQEEFETEDNYYTNPSLDTAAQYLADAGYSDGDLTLTLLTSSSQITTDQATILQALLMQIGINVEIEAYQDSTVSAYVEDQTAWDLYLFVRADNLYMVNAWSNVLYEDNYSWGGTMNFVFDDELQDLLATACGMDTHTPENIIACHDYIVENAYMRGIVGYYSEYAYSGQFEKLFYNEKGFLAPNCCVYQEG